MGSVSRTTTTTVLLKSLREAVNEPVWREFDARYRPILEGFARSLGLVEGEAEEIAQQTLAEFVRDYRAGRYDRTRGRLHSWIIGIAQNLISSQRRAQRRHREQRGELALVDLGDAAQLTAVWQAERDKVIFTRAIEALRSSGRMAARTIQAFELVALRAVPAKEVARECEMSVDEVYVAKNRVTKRLRELVAELTGALEEED